MFTIKNVSGYPYIDIPYGILTRCLAPHLTFLSLLNTNIDTSLTFCEIAKAYQDILKTAIQLRYRRMKIWNNR